ncbi:MAG: hypothetical protein JST80_04830 [Bdellovibrionales bacterium]|nr:hypothetical protein [Bdellovibrionales bacterium]
MSLNAVPPKRPKIEYRGIPSTTLFEQVKNTAPYLFAADAPQKFPQPYAEMLREFAGLAPAELEAEGGDLWSYFDLCLSSHFATVGTFVPTDVDLAIRQKLWNFVHHTAAFLPMWTRIQEMLTWDESIVSRRRVRSASGQKLSGHQGEWFSVAMAAYGSAKKISHPHIVEVRDAIEAEVDRQEKTLQELESAFTDDPTTESARAYSEGVCAVIHNLGDLDRMFEAWKIDDQDVLKRRVFRCGHEDARQPRDVFTRAGKVYQAQLAAENHRHFALREPKCIRQSPDFLLPFGPWLDDWGQTLVEKGFKPGMYSDRDLREVAVALIHGWKTLNSKSIYTSVGYSRALAGIAVGLGDGSLAKGRLELEALVPPIVRREFVEGGLRTLMNSTRLQFEKEWSRKILKLLGGE